MTLPKIYVAIDTPEMDAAKKITSLVKAAGCGIKLGMEFFNANGPQGIEAVQASAPGISLFIDLKYHDIPNTVAGAVRSISRLAPDFLNIHASGGPDMMKAAKDALLDESSKRSIKTPQLLAVTVLTSMDEKAVTSVGWQLPIADQVKRLALLTQQCGLDGVVCSPLEIEIVRASCGAGFTTMVPGIRPASANDDQKRVMTPRDAVAAGVHHMVIGRPITGAADPAQAAHDILASLAA
ncbi:MAG: orotidine-5'-phosphate decarboxylase [Proteobacteria bacterium]|nr:orotidine-5'-phosphate decarboxylase [Pseudomonadota bacterium]